VLYLSDIFGLPHLENKLSAPDSFSPLLYPITPYLKLLTPLTALPTATPAPAT
jgi:hypothetical protein